jgi:uncharacterized protein
MTSKVAPFLHVLALPLLVFACAATSAVPEYTRDRTISVTGTAVTRTTPDTVVWHVTTTSAHRDLVRAKEDSDNQMQAILATARELGVAEDDLQTGYLSVDKEYEYDNYGNQGGFKHFAVTRQITLKERDTSKFDAFLTGLVHSADMEVRYTLESSRIHELRAETRLKSVAIAREKADAMAGELGASLGEVLTINEQTDWGYGNMMANNWAWDDQGGAAAIDATTGTFAPGSIEVKVSVGTVFELR